MFQLAIAGKIPENSWVFRQIDEHLGQIKAYLSPKNGNAEIGLLVSPAYTDAGWKEWVRLSSCPVCGYCSEQKTQWESLCDQLVRIDTPLRDALGDEICDKADLLLMVWNEDVTELDGASWELLRMARRRMTPCIWISAKTKSVYWPEGAYYEPYRPEQLNGLCENFMAAQIEPYREKQENWPLLSLGMRLRRNYLRRYKAAAGQMPAEKDQLLREDYTPEEELAFGEPLRKTILEQFQRFDQSAIDLNERYQAVIYWRAILPFVTTMFLAVGFYAENILGAFPVPKSAAFWTIVAGIGFLIHGLLNLYVFLLSRSKIVKEWHQGFLNDRFIAELLRVLIHFVPFGISLNLRKLCGDNQEIYAAVRRMTEKTQQGEQRVTRATVSCALLHIEEMVDDQIAYHTASERRYSGIVKGLKKWGRGIFFLGFAAVLLRAVFQFAVVFVPLQTSMLGNVAFDKFAKSFANMLALILPAWASYFSTKLVQCNFQYNCENHQQMLSLMKQAKQRIEHLRSSLKDVPIEAMNALGEDLAEIMLVKDTSMWYHQYKGTTVKHF